jgi:uncharacterized membrane protein
MMVMTAHGRYLLFFGYTDSLQEEMRKWKHFGKIITKMEAKAEKHRGTIEKYGVWGLLVLVAIPLPGTGAWTGALVAAIMDIRIRRALPVIALGVIIAGLIVGGISFGLFA